MKGTSRKTALTQTTKEYASRSSIHGISYLFDLDLGFADRLLWLFLVLAFAAVAAALTWNLWIQWRNEQVNAFMYKKINSRLNHPSCPSTTHFEPNIWVLDWDFGNSSFTFFDASWFSIHKSLQNVPNSPQIAPSAPLKPKGFYRASPKISLHWPPPSKCESNLRDFAKSDSVHSKSDSNFCQIL